MEYLEILCCSIYFPNVEFDFRVCFIHFQEEVVCFFFFRGTRKELALEFKVIYFKNYIFFRNKKKKGFSQWDEGQRKRERLLDYASFMFSFQ